MKEYSNGIKGAAIVMHQMFLVLMVCSLYGIGYNMRMHYGGLGILSTLAILGLVGSFVMLAFLTGIIGRRSADDNHIYLQGVDKIYTDVELLIFIGFIYVMLYLCRNISQMRFEFNDILQNTSRSDGRQLVHITYHDEPCADRHGIQKRMHKVNVHHRHLVDDDDIRIQRILSISAKSFRTAAIL